jgi:putative transposase
VLKSFRYRLYPTPAQQTKMNAGLDECRWLYNHFLEQRKTAWEERVESLRFFDGSSTRTRYAFE